MLKIENAYMISRYSSSILILLKKDLFYFVISLIMNVLYNNDRFYILTVRIVLIVNYSQVLSSVRGMLLENSNSEMILYNSIEKDLQNPDIQGF